jgi:uncharacterized protein (TIGR00369 family)
MNQPDLSHCFGCGKANPRGLHLVRQIKGDRAVMELTVEKDLCGFPGILHGGITFIMADEVMCYAILERGLVSVTTAMEIEYLRPGRQGHTIRAEGWVEKTEAADIEAAAMVLDVETGKCLAKVHGSYKVVDMQRF